MSHGSVVGDRFSLVGGSVEDLSAGRWAGGGPVGGTVVGCRWSVA